MLKIRLARVGKKKKPIYRIVVSEASRDTFGKFLEILGHYNPLTKVCEIKKDRILHWISNGAKLSPTLNNLLIDQNVITGEKVKAYRPKKKKKKEEKKEKKTKEKSVEEPKKEEKAKEVKKEVKEEKKEKVKAEEKPKKEEKPVEEKKERTKT